MFRPILSLLAVAVGGRASTTPTLLFVAVPTNDFVVAAASGDLDVMHFPTLNEALVVATVGDGVLVMAEGLLPSNPGAPQQGCTNITAEQWAVITEKHLYVYIEFPFAMPGGDGKCPPPPSTHRTQHARMHARTLATQHSTAQR
jgi:hypothetical protein